MKKLYNDILSQIQEEQQKDRDRIEVSTTDAGGVVRTFFLANQNIQGINVDGIGIISPDNIDIIIGCEPLVFPRIKRDLQDYLSQKLPLDIDQIKIVRAIRDELQS